jgi:hypothetical protein
MTTPWPQAICVAALCWSINVHGQAQAERKPPVPVEPVAAILEALTTNQLVALSEPHTNEQAYELRLKLLRDPRFAEIVNDIVIEAGNARYQDVMDRFIRGEDVPDAALRPAWQDIVSPGTGGDDPLYEGFYRAVRDLNAKLPPARRLRVLLADPPIDWSTVRSGDDLVEWGLKRDVHAADVITREVIAKKRRALLVFGEGHLWRQNPRTNFQVDDLPGSFAGILTRAGHAIYSISTAPVDIMDVSKLTDVSRWPVPSLVRLPGTTLGEMDSALFLPAMSRYLMRDGKRIDIPREQWRVLPIEAQFDALLYLGPRSGLTSSRLPAALCNDPEYRAMRLGRMKLVGQPETDLTRRCTPAR